MSDPNKGSWFIPPRIVQLADGSTLIKPGKAVQRARVADVERWTGVHRRTLSALADCGLIRRALPSPNAPQYYPAEVIEFVQKTEADPAFWNQVRTKAYLSGKTIKSAQPRD
jgi:hypothetical protein